MQITTYHRETGELGAVLSGSDLEMLTHRLRETVGWVPGAWQAATHKVDLATGNIIPKE